MRDSLEDMYKTRYNSQYLTYMYDHIDKARTNHENECPPITGAS